MSLISKLQQQQETEVSGLDLSPLLDVVFILLIFFIVSTVFVRESGVDVDKPESVAASELERASIIIAITAQGEVYQGGSRIGLEGVRTVVEQLQSEEPRPVVLQTDKTVPAEQIVRVIDEVKLAGAETVSIATLTNTR